LSLSAVGGKIGERGDVLTEPEQDEIKSCVLGELLSVVEQAIHRNR
jgi:hypothetical protein